MKDNEFNWVAYTREHGPNLATINTGPASRARDRRGVEPYRRLIVIDEELVEQFKPLAANEEELHALIHQALEEWLAARGLKEMLRSEIQLAVKQSLAAAQTNGVPA